MTDRTDHRAEAERLLADAYEWGKQAEEPTPEVGELTCLAHAQVHALLAIHDTLTAADRYAANEAKQREAEPDPLDHSAERCGWKRPMLGPDVSCELPRGHTGACSFDQLPSPDPLDEEPARPHTRRLASCVERWPDCASGEYNPACCRFPKSCSPLAPDTAQDAARDDLSASEGEGGSEEGTDKAAMEDALRKALAPESDPLNEDDWSDRNDRDGDLWGRNPGGCWHDPTIQSCHTVGCGQTLAYLNERWGPLTFAPEPPQEATGDDLSAPEGESGAEAGSDTDDAQEPLLCPACGLAGVSIDEHNARGCRYVMCDCKLSPSDIARALTADAVKAERLKLAGELRTLLSTWRDDGAPLAFELLATRWEQQ